MSRLENIRIGLDIDDCLADFWGAYIARFGQPKSDFEITKNVERILKNDRNFWLNLPKLRDLDFEPTLYCTKRVNNKAWTKKWLIANGFPDKPIYQVHYQKGNKANFIKGRVDLFIDDSFVNVVQCNNAGILTLLADTEGNKKYDIPYRINDISTKSICEFLNTL